MNVDTFDYGTETWVEEAISNGKRRHQDTKSWPGGMAQPLKARLTTKNIRRVQSKIRTDSTGMSLSDIA